MRQSEVIALAQKNARNIREQTDQLCHAVLIMSYGEPQPSPPPGWSYGRWTAAIKTFRSLLEGIE